MLPRFFLERRIKDEDKYSQAYTRYRTRRLLRYVQHVCEISGHHVGRGLSRMYPARQRAAATKPEQLAVPAHPKVKWLLVRSVRMIESILR
jgi:hypothetical protein